MSVCVGVIGCGNISKFHFSGLEKAGARVAWVCDLREAAARPWAERFGAQCTTDWRRVIADPEVQAVTVTAISAVHRPICLAAIAAGKAVICEKTLAVNANEALEIVRAAEQAGTVFYTSYMKRFIPAFQKAHELLPRLGRIVSTSIRAYQCWGDLWSAMPASGFFHTPPGGTSQVVSNFGGGILVCGGSHILDLVCWLLGRPARVYATLVIPEGRDYDVQAAALLETAHGIVHYEALAHPLRQIGFLNDGWDERVEINGTAGRIEVFSAAWDRFDYKASKLVHYDNHTGNSTEYRYAPASPFDLSVAFYLDGIAKGCQGSQSRLTGYEVDELIEHIKLSAQSGQAVTLNWRI
jgi:predicted dehydrogenase